MDRRTFLATPALLALPAAAKTKDLPPLFGSMAGPLVRFLQDNQQAVRPALEATHDPAVLDLFPDLIHYAWGKSLLPELFSIQPMPGPTGFLYFTTHANDGTSVRNVPAACRLDTTGIGTGLLKPDTLWDAAAHLDFHYFNQAVKTLLAVSEPCPTTARRLRYDIDHHLTQILTAFPDGTGWVLGHPNTLQALTPGRPNQDMCPMPYGTLGKHRTYQTTALPPKTLLVGRRGTLHFDAGLVLAPWTLAAYDPTLYSRHCGPAFPWGGYQHYRRLQIA